MGELVHLHLGNLCGHHSFNLSKPLDFILANRLKSKALEEMQSGETHTHPWRNVVLNGRSISSETISKLEMYHIPDCGMLQMDFVDTKVFKWSCCAMAFGSTSLASCTVLLRFICGEWQGADCAEVPIEDGGFQLLIRSIRKAQCVYFKDMQKTREEYLSHGRTQSDLSYYEEAIPFRIKCFDALPQDHCRYISFYLLLASNKCCMAVRQPVFGGSFLLHVVNWCVPLNAHGFVLLVTEGGAGVLE